MSVFAPQLELVESADTHSVQGRVVDVTGLTIGVAGGSAEVRPNFQPAMALPAANRRSTIRSWMS